MDTKTLRQKRQAKIKAAGADRLAKITKSYSSVNYKDDKAPNGFTDSQNDDQTAEIQEIPRDNVSAAEPTTPDINDPLFRLLAEMKESAEQTGFGTSSSGTPVGAEGAKKMSLDPFTALFGSLPQSPPEEEAATLQRQTKPLSWSRDFWWPLMHILFSIFLALYSLQSGSTHSLVWQFCTMELMLHSSRFVLDRGAPPQVSVFTTIAGYLPQPFKTYVLTAARYLHIGKSAIQDLCVILFVVGIVGGGKIKQE